MRATLHLAVSLDGPGHDPAAWREPDAQPERLFDAAYYVDLVRLAERGRLDFVVLEDGFDRPDFGDGQRGGRLDALLTLARVAPSTTSIGLMAAVTTTHTEPFHVSKNVATLDFVSLGRAGWKVTVSTSDADAALFGRKPAAARPELYEEAADAIEVVARLWDSWEDDAVIRDLPTGRYIDRDKVHYVDFEGRFFRVRGPSITPRSPQAQPPLAMDGTSEEALRVATARADIVFVEPPGLASGRALRDEIRARAAAAGRIADDVTVMVAVDGGESAAPLAARMEEWFRAGAADGFVVRAGRLPHDLVSLVDDVVPRLQAAGVFRREYAGRTLRDHLGSSRPANRYAVGAS